VRTTWTLAHGAERTTRAFAVRVYTLPELRRLLGGVGLELERAWGGYDGGEYDMDARRMVALARASA
jgi:hypothetical protein